MPRAQTFLKSAELTANIKTVDVESFFNDRIIGQTNAATTIANILQANAVGFKQPNKRPIANVFMLGPTGVGKTETVITLAEYLHNNRNHLIRVDCGEFQHSHEVAKLIGSPPGYLGHRETAPALSQEALSSVTSDKNKISIVLFDEIEKASDAVHRILLGIMDNGVLNLGDNRKVFFNNSIVFFTSNIGVTQNKSYNFVKEETKPNTEKVAEFKTAVQKVMPPEFINRIDSFIVFDNLTQTDINKIVDLMLSKVLIDTEPDSVLRRIQLKLTNKLQNFLVEAGYSREYGARYLARTIHQHIKMPLAKAECDDGLLTAAFYNNKLVKLDTKNGKTIVSLVDKKD